MIQGLLSLLRVHYVYTDPIRRQRAQSLMYMVWMLGILAISLIAFMLIPSFTGAGNPQNIWTIFILCIAPLFLLLIRRWIEQGRLERAALLFITFLTVALTTPAVAVPGVFNGFLLIIPLIAAGTLFNRTGLLIVFALILVALLLRAVSLANNDAIIRVIPSIDGAIEIALIGLVLISGAVFLIGFSGNSERVAQVSLNELRHWQAFAQVRKGQLTEADQLAQQVVEILQGDLGYNLAQIYFADEAGFITRRIRVSGIDRQFALRMEDLPTIGEVVRDKRARAFRRDVSTIQDYPLAPSRVGIVAPIVYSGIVLGIIDAQTRSPETPSTNVILAFTAFAEALADNLMNARRVIELQKTVDDQEQVIALFRTRLTELQSRGSQMVSSSWIRYLEGRGGHAVGFDVDVPEGKPTAHPASDLTPEIRAVLSRGELYIETAADGSRIVNVPILLREEILGAMTFNVPPETALTERQIETLRTVSSRLGQSLENNRLFEQSQAQAARERKASEVSARLIGATNVENLLEVAASSFNEALGAVFTRVLLEPDDSNLRPIERSVEDEARSNGTNGANGSHKRS